MSVTPSAELPQRETQGRAPPEAVGSPVATALVLRPDDRPLLALHHAPRTAQQRTVGFVLCNTVGYDAMCAYRTYRHAAELLAQAGFPALRFDYLGTGNSAAGEGRCAEDIGAAIDALKERSGVSSVVLLGVRAGALLAAGVAAVRADVAGVALLATPPSGRSFVRELKAFQAASGEPPRFRRRAQGRGLQPLARAGGRAGGPRPAGLTPRAADAGAGAAARRSRG